MKELLICPGRDIRIGSRIDIPVVENVFELTKLIGDVSILSISNVRLVEMLIAYQDMFDVEVGLLTGVPGCDYSPQFEQVTWSLKRDGYDAMVVDMDAAQRMEKLKKAEKPRSNVQLGSDDANNVDISKLKKPGAFSVFDVEDTIAEE